MQSSLMFDSKAGTYPRVETSRCFTLGYTPGLTQKLYIRLESSKRGKHSSLLQTFVNYGRKKFSKIGPRTVVADSDKHASLLYYGIKCVCKKFYSASPWNLFKNKKASKLLLLSSGPCYKTSLKCWCNKLVRLFGGFTYS
jgi:hypothetical protein